MAHLLLTALLFAADSPGPGRGENPSDVGGILVIVGIALVVLAGLFVAMYRRKSRVR